MKTFRELAYMSEKSGTKVLETSHFGYEKDEDFGITLFSDGSVEFINIDGNFAKAEASSKIAKMVMVMFRGADFVRSSEYEGAKETDGDLYLDYLTSDDERMLKGMIKNIQKMDFM